MWKLLVLVFCALVVAATAQSGNRKIRLNWRGEQNWDPKQSVNIHIQNSSKNNVILFILYFTKYLQDIEKVCRRGKCLDDREVLRLCAYGTSLGSV